MKEAKKAEFVIKHREDVIDTLMLRAKEKRVLYSLLIVLLMTMAYENNSWLLSSVFSENHNVPELGERRGYGINSQLFKPINNAIVHFSNEYPQFWANIERQKQQSRELMETLSDPAMKQQALQKAFVLLQEVKTFISHPALSQTKKLQEIDKEISRIARSLNYKFVENIDYKVVAFGQKTSLKDSSVPRNLFDFSDY